MSQVATVEHEELDPEEFYRTNDMAMSTFLKLNQHDLQAVRWESGTCYWIFRVTDAILDLVEDFTAGRALVEPKAYNRIFTATKREFYDSRNHHIR